MSKNTDLFGFFDAMNKGNFSFVDEMSDEEVKGLSPFVLLMWTHGATSNTAIHVMMTDMYCSSFVFSLSKHPRLLLKLFIAANCDIDNTRYKFKKATQTKESKLLLHVADFYQCGYNEAKQYMSILSEEDLKGIQEIYDEVKD